MFYVRLTVCTKKIPTEDEDTQKEMRKESKHVTTTTKINELERKTTREE